jgi:predicted metal-dependent enzyme (double-stranded beta helix superfamily)
MLDIVLGTPGSTLSSALSQIDHLTKHGGKNPEEEVSDILAAVSLDPLLLRGFNLEPSREKYTRHHLAGGENFSFLAIVWLPGQASPIHSHKTWCAFAVHGGFLTETLFCRNDNGGVDLTSEKRLHRGYVSHSRFQKSIAHRLGNTGTRPAISLHVYGVHFDRLGGDCVNYIWDSNY